MRYLAIILSFLLFACAGAQIPSDMVPPQQVEVKLQIEGVDNVAVRSEKDGIVKSMEVKNPDLELSTNTTIVGDRAIMYLYSYLSKSDWLNMILDFIYLEDFTDVRRIEYIINSGGGGAFDGLALVDLIQFAQRRGFYFDVRAYGLIASATVPVLAVCDNRVAAPSCFFMVHESSLWKWPGTESHSSIKAQGNMMDLLRDRYLNVLSDHSNLSADQWGDLEGKTTWFTATQALEWGLIDVIE